MMHLGLLNTRVGQRFLALLLGVSLLPLATIGWFAIREGEAALHRETFSTLRAATDGAEAQIREFLRHLREEVVDLSQDESLISELRAAAASPTAGNGSSQQLCELLKRRQRALSDATEIFIMSPAGRVLASDAARSLGRDASGAEYFRRGKQGFYPGDIQPDANGMAWIMAAPIRDSHTGAMLAELGFRVDAQTLSDLTTGRRVRKEGADTECFRIGKTGETYIVNRQGWMITESRFIPDAMFKVKVDTLPVRRAQAEGKETAADYVDYRGVRVSGASMLLPELGWVVLGEIDFSQAFAPLENLRNALLALTVVLGLLVVLLAYWSARWIVRPLQLVSASDKALAAGDETGAFVAETALPNDEIGDFVRRRNARLKELLEHQRQLLKEQQERVEAVAELERMSYSIMHDMRAPLRAIIGFGEVIEAEAGPYLNAQAHIYLDRTKRAAARMDRLICDVLNYSRIALEEVPLRPVNVLDLLRSIMETYPNLQALRTSIDLPTTSAVVLANEAALAQCLSNLLDNALRFVKPGGAPQVQVRIRDLDAWVRIVVADHGPGIPQEFKERIFGIFVRGHSETEGTGIGLAIVRKAAERMGGRVGVNSTPGQGSEFWIELHTAAELARHRADLADKVAT